MDSDVKDTANNNNNSPLFAPFQRFRENITSEFTEIAWNILGVDPVSAIGSAGTSDDLLNNSDPLSPGFPLNGTSWPQTNLTPVGTTVDPNFIPPDLSEMSPRARNTAIAYGILFLIAATGNLSVFMSVLKQLRKTKSRICLLILHLSVADLVVTFFLMPMEIIWRITVAWYGGNSLCKICQFLRAFGLYLSSNVLICISLDRYFAIIHPLRTSGARKRGRAMLTAAWVSAALCAFPQMLIFEVKTHPHFQAFQQCVTGFFDSPGGEDVRAYSIASVSFMYLLPLIVIFFTYGRIIWKMSVKSKEHRESCKHRGETTGRILLRRSDATNNMERAKNRTLKLTLVIVLVFVMCWTPYVVITLWYMFDKEGASKVDKHVQESLFIMAVANSCVNPLIYGSYTKECRETMGQCCVSDSSRRSHGGIQPSRISKATTSSRTLTTSPDGASIGAGSNIILRNSLRRHSSKQSQRYQPNRHLTVNFGGTHTHFYDAVPGGAEGPKIGMNTIRFQRAASISSVTDRITEIYPVPGCYECGMRAST